MDSDFFILEKQAKISPADLIQEGIRLFHGGSIEFPSTCSYFTITDEPNHEQPEIFWFSDNPVHAAEYGDLNEINLEMMARYNIPIYYHDKGIEREYMIEAEYCFERFIRIEADPFDL